MSTTDVDSLADHWLHQGDWESLARLLADTPAGNFVQRPALLRLRAHLWWHEHAWENALTALENACQLAVQQGDWPLAVECALDEARWHQSREDMRSASAHLERARRYAETMSEADLGVQAKLALAIGRLAPDLEQAELGVEWCARALALYEKLGDSAGQVDALWNLAINNTYTGRLLEASSQAQRALRLHQVSGLDPLRRLYLLNLVACMALYRGDTEAGLRTIRDAEPLATQHPNTKPLLYLADTEADLLRQRGDLEAALTAHGRVEAILVASGDEGYRPWLEMDRGWTRVLSGETPGRVRRDLLKVGDLQDSNMRRYLNLYIALLDVLEGRLGDALARLQTLRQQFVTGGERLYVFAVDLYQAYVHLVSGRDAECRQALARGLGWAEEAAVDGFALWWHPHMIARVCVEALRAGIHPRQAEVMIVRRLSDVAIPGLLALMDEAEPAARQRARSVLAALDRDAVLPALDAQADPSIRKDVLAHLAHGRLTLTGLNQLRQQLETGSPGATWQRLAIFGWYAANDASREEIGERLALSEGAVKKHIAAIRAAFGIESKGGRDIGRQAVTQRAVTERLTLRNRGL